MVPKPRKDKGIFFKIEKDNEDDFMTIFQVFLDSEELNLAKKVILLWVLILVLKI